MKKKSSEKNRIRSTDSDSGKLDMRKLSRMFEYLAVADLTASTRTLAVEIFDKYAEGTSRPDEVTAHLFYDSRAVPSVTGMRPSLMSERRLKYMAGRSVIELSVTPVFPGRFEVTGRIGDDDGDRPSEVVLKGRRRIRTKVDGFGFFSFSRIDPGEYSLSYTIGEERVELDDLELG